MAGIFGASAPANSAANATVGDLSKDVAISDPPSDSISDLAFSSASDHLALASWDKKVRIYEIDGNGNSIARAAHDHEGPVLSVAWSQDGTKLFSAGADKAAREYDLTTQQARQVAAHDAPIRVCKSIVAGGNQMLVTGGWDKMLKYWDLRAQAPAAQIECKDRIYTMDNRNDMLVVGTADRWIHVLDIKSPTNFYKTLQSPLKWQTRVVSIFSPDPNGFAIGSIEGRCAIQYVEDKDASNNFSFKCHRANSPTERNTSNVFAVNAISFHPIHGTFSTAGSDGTFHFWDKDAKHRLKGYPEVGGTISATGFNRSGNIFAYAVSYDWSKGYANNNANLANKVMLHPIQADECKPRPKGTKR